MLSTGGWSEYIYNRKYSYNTESKAMITQNNNLQNSSSEERIPIPCTKTIEFIKSSDIVRFEGMQNYTKVFLNNGTMLISSDNIGKYKTTMLSRGFICCHKSHIVNSNKINRYFKAGYVEMTDGTSVPVSRRKKTEFQKSIVMNFTSPQAMVSMTA